MIYSDETEKQEAEKIKEISIVPMMVNLDNISIVSIVLFIAAGLLLFILAFIFAKRQIMRFTMKSLGSPHFVIGMDAPKGLRQEIQRRLERVGKIKYEPVLLNAHIMPSASTVPNHYYYRMKAVDAFSKFDEALKEEEPESLGRHPSKPVRHYLLGLYTDYLDTSSSDLIHRFADAYEHARHDPKEFGEEQYNIYMELLDELINSLRNGVRKKRDHSLSGHDIKKDTEVILENDNSGETKTKIQIQNDNSNNKNQKGKKTYDKVRYRSRAGSSGQSSLLDSGHSSIPSTVSVEGFTNSRDSPEAVITS